MARDKLIPGVERETHYHAYTVWRDLGYGRSYRKTAQLIGASAQSVCKWAKLYDWPGRLKEHAAVVKEKQEDGALVKIDDPVVQKITTMMEQVEALIDSCFIKDRITGRPSIKKGGLVVKSVLELSTLVKEYRQLLESYHKFVAEHKPAASDRDKTTKIEKFNVYMGNVSQEERIALMESMKNGHEPGRDKRAGGDISDADYNEVSERGNEDRP